MDRMVRLVEEQHRGLLGLLAVVDQTVVLDLVDHQDLVEAMDLQDLQDHGDLQVCRGVHSSKDRLYRTEQLIRVDELVVRDMVVGPVVVVEVSKRDYQHKQQVVDNQEQHHNIK